MILILSRDKTLQNPWQRLMKRSVIREREALGESFMLVHPGQNPNWVRLAQRLGRYASRVVCSEEMDLPQSRPWRRMDCSSIEEQIMGNTLCSFSEQLDWVGLYDPQGIHQQLAWRLLQHFPRVTLWCRERQAYQDISETMMEELGAAPELTCDWNGFADCPLIGALEIPEFRLRWKGKLLLSGRSDIPHLQGILCDDLPLTVPQELLSICPNDLDPRKLYLAFLKENSREVSQTLRYLIPEKEASSNIEKFL